MANRYWVGGTASWDGTAGTKWALTSGGAGGQAIPTSSDDVYFDANSGAVTVTMPYLYPAYHRCNNFITTGFTGTINHTGGALEVYGTTFTLGSGMTFTGSATQIYFYSTGSVTITTNGITCPNSLYFSGSGGTYTTSGALTTNGFIVHTANNTLTVGGNVTCKGYQGSGTCTLNMGSGLWTLTQDQITTLWQPSATQTLNKQTANIKIDSTTSSNLAFYGRGFTYNEIWFNNTNSTVTIDGSNTISNLKISAGRTVKFTDGTTQTVTSVDIVGTSGSSITLTGTSTGGWTLSDTTGTNTVEYCNISYSTVTGGATWTTKNCINIGNNTGWDFPSTYTLLMETGIFNITCKTLIFDKVEIVTKDKPISIIININKP